MSSPSLGPEYVGFRDSTTEMRTVTDDYSTTEMRTVTDDYSTTEMRTVTDDYSTTEMRTVTDDYSTTVINWRGKEGEGGKHAWV